MKKKEQNSKKVVIRIADKVDVFMSAYHEFRSLVECGKRRLSVDDYISSLPTLKANELREIRLYRNELAFNGRIYEDPNIDKWIEILQEEIKNLNNKKK